MFRNIKKLSEALRYSGSFIYREGEVPPAIPDQIDREKVGLNVQNSFEILLGERNEALTAFVERYKNAKPQMTYTEANQGYAEMIGKGDLSPDAQKGLVRVLQRYLNERGKLTEKLDVDGLMGPKTVDALSRRGTQLAELSRASRAHEVVDPWTPKEERHGWVEGVTKVAYELGGSMYYLTYDGHWIDIDHKGVNPAQILPKIGRELGASKIYVLEDSSHKKAFYNSEGKELRPYNSKSSSEFFFRLADRSWVNQDGVKVDGKDVIPKIASVTYINPSTNEATYQVFGTAGANRIAFNAKGDEIEIVSTGSEPAPEATPAPVRVAAKTPKQPERPTPEADILPWVQVRDSMKAAGFSDCLHPKYNIFTFIYANLGGTLKVNPNKSISVSFGPKSPSDYPTRTAMIAADKAQNLRQAMKDLMTEVKAYRREQLGFDQGQKIKDMTPSTAHKYLAKAGFEWLGDTPDGQYLFRYHGLEGAMRVLEDGSGFMYALSRPESTLPYTVKATPRDIVGRDRYLAQDMPTILRIIGRNLDDYQKKHNV